MHKTEFVIENEMHKILWNLEIQTDYSVLVRRLKLALINKKKRICHLVDFIIPIDHNENIRK